MAELKGNKYGTNRVIEPKGVLTQGAWKIYNDMSKVYSNEIDSDVTSLNIDSASFTHNSEACGGDEKKIGEMPFRCVAFHDIPLHTEKPPYRFPHTAAVGLFAEQVAVCAGCLLYTSRCV